MERDTIIAHGATDFLRESMMERGDDYQMAVCNTSGMIAIYNPAKNVFLSPMADGPIKFIGSIDDKSLHIDNVSQFGRNFSIVKIPYSMKLLMQELLAINISMRIITEDNIEQLENMSFSNNIDLLLQRKNVDPKEIVQKIRNTLSRNRENQNKFNTPLSIDSPVIEQESPSYHPITPELDEESPGYNPISPTDTPPQNFIPTTPPSPPPTSNQQDINIGSENSSASYHPISPNSIQSDPFSVSTDGSIPPPPTSTPPDVTRGGGVSEFKENDLVYYRSDLKPTRIWKIHKIGNEFITIKTEDMEGIDSIDTTKIVPMSHIYSMQDYPYSSIFKENTNTSVQPHDTKIRSDQPTININVAPVFKNQSKDEISEGGSTDIDDNMVMPGIKVKSDNVTSTKTETPNDPNLFSGGIIVKKT